MLQTDLKYEHFNHHLMKIKYGGFGLLIFISLWGCQNDAFTDSGYPLPEVIDYNFDVKPILSDRCFNCHGPDAAKREADLRLDIAEAAYASLSSARGLQAIFPGKPKSSAVYQRIYSEDPGTDNASSRIKVAFVRS